MANIRSKMTTAASFSPSRSAARLVVMTALMLLCLPGTAQVYDEEAGALAVTPNLDGATASVQFAGGGFDPGSIVGISLQSNDNASIVELGELNANQSGAVNGHYTLPSDITDGTYAAIAEGVTPDGSTLVLTGQLVVGQGDAEGSPRSGSNIWWWVGGGLAVIAAGGVTARAVAARRDGA